MIRRMAVICGRDILHANLEGLISHDEEGALFADLGGFGCAVWIARDRLPRREQVAIWPNATPIPVTDWPGSSLVDVGDPVAERVVDDFAGLLPPATWTASLLQVGEAMDHNAPGGMPRYMTFRRESDGWAYAGILAKGSAR